MNTTFHYFENSQELLEVLQSNEQHEQIKAHILLVADENQAELESIHPHFQDFSKTLAGGVFPELIVNSERKLTGFLLVSVSFSIELSLVSLSSDSITSNIEKAIPDQFLTQQGGKSVFVFVDAFAAKKETFISELYEELGTLVSYVGGGCGSLSFQQKKCVFTNSLIRDNAAILGFAQKQITLGVAHGWEPISDSLKVTETAGTTIKTIDWKPAFTVYREIVEKHSNQVFTNDNFFDIAKSYPLGLERVDAELIVRDPISTEGDFLNIVDQVPEGEFIQILNGNKEKLLEGARSARSHAEIDSKAENIFTIDCISRVLYFNEEFQNELEILSGKKPLYGILSLGEIANNGDTFLSIFNKTVAVTNI